MHGIITVGLGCCAGGAGHSGAMNFCCLACFCAGFLLLGVAFWHLRQAPEAREAALPRAESPRP